MPSFDAIESLASAGKKIQAIKEFRAATGVGLKDAKDAVEYFQAHQRWPAQYLQEPEPEPEPASGSDPRLHAIEQHLAQGRLIHAVKDLRELTHWGLKDSKEAVDAYRASGRWPSTLLAMLGSAPVPVSAPASAASTPISPHQVEIEGLMASNKKINAIKRLRELTHWGLKDSKEAVDHYQHHGTWPPAVLEVFAGTSAPAQPTPAPAPAPTPAPTPTQAPAPSGPAATVITTAPAEVAMLKALARMIGYAPEVLLSAPARRVAADGRLVVLRDRTCFMGESQGQWTIDPVLMHDAVASVEVHRGLRATLYVSLGYLHERFEMDPADADAALALLRVYAR